MSKYSVVTTAMETKNLKSNLVTYSRNPIKSTVLMAFRAEKNLYLWYLE